jgi:CRP/FNR family cyclic AMP-dependent transcriptional regulator
MAVRLHRDQRIDLLRGVDLLAGCTKDQLRQIASLSTELDVPAGRVLAKQGELGLEFFVIVEGTAKASRNGVVLATLTPTDFFGELALLDGGGRSATVVADTDMHLLVLTRAEFNRLCRSYPKVAQRMLAVIGGRLRKADEMLGSDRRSDAPERLTV